MTRTRTVVPGLVVAVLALGGLAACSGDDDAADATTAASGAPADLGLVEDGVLKIGIDATYPPMEYREGGQLRGLNIDLATDLAERLGLEAEFVDVAFDDLRPTAAANEIDLISSSMTDTAERQAEVDFVDYFVAGAQLLVAADDDLKLTAPMDWCGLRAATTGGTTDGDIVEAQSELCVKAGREPVTFVDVPYTKSVEEVLAGRADFGVEDLPAAVYLAEASGGRIEVLGEQLQPQPYGYGVAKNRTALRDALQRALQESIADGTYDAILEEHGMGDGALRTTSLNGGA